MPNPVTYLNQAPKFEWFVIKCGSKEQIPKTQSFKKIRLHAQHMLTILMVNINGSGYMTIE